MPRVQGMAAWKATKAVKMTWKDDQRLLGKTFIDHQNGIALTIGRDQWTRRQLVEHVRVGNFAAAKILSRAAATLEVKSVADFARRFSVEQLFRVKGVGETTCFVWMCVLDAMTGGAIDWLDLEQEDLVTLDTLRNRAKKKKKLA